MGRGSACLVGIGALALIVLALVFIPALITSNTTNANLSLQFYDEDGDPINFPLAWGREGVEVDDFDAVVTYNVEVGPAVDASSVGAWGWLTVSYRSLEAGRAHKIEWREDPCVYKKALSGEWRLAYSVNAILANVEHAGQWHIILDLVLAASGVEEGIQQGYSVQINRDARFTVEWQESKFVLTGEVVVD